MKVELERLLAARDTHVEWIKHNLSLLSKLDREAELWEHQYKPEIRVRVDQFKPWPTTEQLTEIVDGIQKKRLQRAKLIGKLEEYGISI